MPAIDVVLIRADDGRASVGRVAHVVDLERPRREQRGLAARDRHRVEMLPAVALPREDEPLLGRPRQLRTELHRLEHAAAAGCRAPHLAAGAGGHVGHADRPRLAFALGEEDHAVAHRRPADEREARAVGRPRRRVVGVERRLQPRQRARGDGEHADEGVGAASAHERQPRSIGRPRQRPRAAAHLRGLRRRRRARHAAQPDLPALHERHQAASGDTAAAPPPTPILRGAPPADRHRPHGLLGAGRVAGGIRDLAGAVRPRRPARRPASRRRARTQCR